MKNHLASASIFFRVYFLIVFGFCMIGNESLANEASRQVVSDRKEYSEVGHRSDFGMFAYWNRQTDVILVFGVVGEAIYDSANPEEFEKLREQTTRMLAENPRMRHDLTPKALDDIKDWALQKVADYKNYLARSRPEDSGPIIRNMVNGENANLREARLASFKTALEIAGRIRELTSSLVAQSQANVENPNRLLLVEKKHLFDLEISNLLELSNQVWDQNTFGAIQGSIARLKMAIRYIAGDLQPRDFDQGHLLQAYQRVQVSYLDGAAENVEKTVRTSQDPFLAITCSELFAN